MATFVALRSVWFPNAADLTNADLADFSSNSVALFVGETFDEAARKAFAHAETDIAEHNRNNSFEDEENDETLRLVNEDAPEKMRYCSWTYGVEGSDPTGNEDAEGFVWFFASEVVPT